MHDTLLQALRPHFPLHRTRLHLMVQLLCAMLTLGTVRLPRLAALATPRPKRHCLGEDGT